MTEKVLPEGWVLPPRWTVADERPTNCRSCGDEILWATTTKGKRAPVNRDGTSHFATCPQADTWRRR